MNPKNWSEAVDALGAVSKRHAKSLRCAEFITCNALGEIWLSFGPKDLFHASTVFGTNKPLIESSLSTHFGRPVTIHPFGNALGDCAVRE